VIPGTLLFRAASASSPIVADATTKKWLEDRHDDGRSLDD
jgi:hypothetical protein